MGVHRFARIAGGAARPRRLLRRVTAALATLIALSTPARGQVVVTYLGNDGFLLAGGGRTVLIDALFGDGIEGYERVSPELRSRLEAGEAPFDTVDLVLATHYHPDHFAPAAVIGYLRSNPRAAFLSTPQAVEELEPLLADLPQVGERVEEVFPPRGRPVRLSRGGVDLEVYNLHHGKGRRPPVQNLGFLFEIGGLKVLHVGDSEVSGKELRRYALGEQRIGLALLPFWLLVSEPWIETVRTQIRPTSIGVMHLPRPAAPGFYFGSAGNYGETVRRLQAAFPDAVLFERSGAAVTFPRTTP